MIDAFDYDAHALERDPNLVTLSFDAGLHEGAFNTAVGQQIYHLVTSRFAIAAMIGALVVAPSRPPVVAVEPLLFQQIGSEAFSDEMKKLTGRIVRFAIEHIGGRWERRGVKVTTRSRYRSGSVYSLT